MTRILIKACYNFTSTSNPRINGKKRGQNLTNSLLCLRTLANNRRSAYFSYVIAITHSDHRRIARLCRRRAHLDQCASGPSVPLRTNVRPVSVCRPGPICIRSQYATRDQCAPGPSMSSGTSVRPVLVCRSGPMCRSGSMCVRSSAHHLSSRTQNK